MPPKKRIFNNNIGGAVIDKKKVALDITLMSVGKNLIVGRKTTGSGLYQIDPNGKTLQDTSNVDASSSGSGISIVYAANQNRIYQAATERIDVYDATDQSFITSINTGYNATYLAYAENTQKLFIRDTTTTAGNLISYDTVSGSITVIGTGLCVGGVTYNSDNGKIYACWIGDPFGSFTDAIIEVDTSTNSITNSSSLMRARLTAIQYIPETGFLYVMKSANAAGSFVNSLIKVNPSTLSTVSTTLVTNTLSIVGTTTVGTDIKYLENKIYLSWQVLAPVSTWYGFLNSFDSTTTAQLDNLTIKGVNSTQLITFEYVDNLQVLAINMSTSVYFVNPFNTYNGLDLLGTADITLADSGQGMLYNSIGYAETSTVDVFDGTQQLPTGVTATMVGTYTYAQFVQSLQGTPISVKKISVFTNFGLPKDGVQLGKTINFVRNTQLGTSATDQQYPTIDPYQKQNAIINLPVDEFKLDALNYIQYTFFKGSTVQLTITGEYMNEKLISEEVGIDKDDSKAKTGIEQPYIPIINWENINPLKRLCR